MKFPTKTSASCTQCQSRRYIRGQGLTEYIILVSLAAVAAIGAASYFGDTVKANFVALGSELTGGAKFDTEAATATARQKAETSVTTETTLGNYGD